MDEKIKYPEEAAKQFVGYDMDTDDLRDYEVGIQAFIAGAEWQKEQMLENAREGEVIDAGNFIKFKDGKYIDLNPTEGVPCFSFQDGDKVKVILVKEDENEQNRR